MAQGLLQARLKNRVVHSAGISALVGHPADSDAIDVMTARGYDIRGHRAQQIRRSILNNVDLVLTLDKHHTAWINMYLPEYRGRVHKLLRWQENGDVPDPYKQSRLVFEEVFSLIDRGVDDWMKRL